MSKDFLGFKLLVTKEIIGRNLWFPGLQSPILHPKNTKFGKSDVLKSLEIA